MARGRKKADEPTRSKRSHKRVAVKIVDDRGIESLKIIPLP